MYYAYLKIRRENNSNFLKFNQNFLLHLVATILEPDSKFIKEKPKFTRQSFRL